MSNIPIAAAVEGLQVSLSSNQVTSIVANLRQQIGGEPTLRQVLDGISYYVDNDAYLIVQ